MNATQSNIKKYALLYFSFFIYSLSAICAKLASRQTILFWMVFFIGLEIACLGLYAVIWQQVLKYFSLIVAMSNKGIVVIFNLIWSLALFNESISIYNLIGALIICGGIWVVSTDG